MAQIVLINPTDTTDTIARITNGGVTLQYTLEMCINSFDMLVGKPANCVQVSKYFNVFCN